MDIYYNNKTLFVNIINDITLDNIDILQNRIFLILDRYDIKDVNIKIHCQDYDEYLFDSLIANYNKRYKGNLNIE